MIHHYALIDLINGDDHQSKKQATLDEHDDIAMLAAGFNALITALLFLA